jgi:hypothetical protein
MEETAHKGLGLKDIVSSDFDAIFFILSYSLDVRQVPLPILFLLLSYNPDSGTEFIPNSDRLWDKIAHMGSTQHHP